MREHLRAWCELTNSLAVMLVLPGCRSREREARYLEIIKQLLIMRKQTSLPLNHDINNARVQWDI